jgi:transposase-like protein
LVNREELNLIEVLQVKYLNNIVEQSHCRVKGKMNQALGWRSDEGAKATLAGIELWSMIKNGQLDNQVCVRRLNTSTLSVSKHFTSIVISPTKNSIYVNNL